MQGIRQRAEVLPGNPGGETGRNLVEVRVREDAEQGLELANVAHGLFASGFVHLHEVNDIAHDRAIREVDAHGATDVHVSLKHRGDKIVEGTVERACRYVDYDRGDEHAPASSGRRRP